MKKKRFWISLSLVNLCIVALLGFTLRTKILFPLPFLNYEHFINAHSHFAFGGWITLAFFTLFTYTLLPKAQQENRQYQWLLWGVELSSLGMLLSFPFQGYGAVSISFSVLFIICTYVYSWRFAKDLLAGNRSQPVLVFSLSALACLVLSSAGPFTLAYILSSGSANIVLYRDALYFYLHFQYNGFFTLAVFALFFGLFHGNRTVLPDIRRFAYLLCASVFPSVVLSMLWHPVSPLLQAVAWLGVVLILCSLYYFFRIKKELLPYPLQSSFLLRALWLLALFSFVIKSVLQTSTIVPALGNAVFGVRPAIIGFLHLVFLGLATFFILFQYVHEGMFDTRKPFTRFAFYGFIAAVVLQETLLLLQGVGLLLGSFNPVYNWLLWIASILLVAGTVLLLTAHFKTRVSKRREELLAR